MISTHDFVRLCRVCRVFVLPLQGDGRVGGRLPRAALGGCAASLCPGLTCFAPSGQGGFSTRSRFFGAWRFLPGVAVSSAPGRRGATVLTPRRGNDKLAQGRASRRSRDAPPWVARPPQVPSPRRGTTRPRTGCDHDQLRNGCNWMASIRGPRRAKRMATNRPRSV